MNSLILSNLLVFLAVFPIASLTENATFENVSIKIITKRSFNREKIESKTTLIRSNYVMEVLQGIADTYFREIRIENQSMPVIYENAFEDLNLMVLSLRNCDTSIIENNAFVNVSRVDEFSMQNTSLKVVPKGVFNDLPVRTLDLAYNKINMIESGAFAGLSSIESIVLSGNKLTEVQRGVFVDLKTLKSLDIGNNLITNVEVGSFTNLTNLRVLGLNDNQFHEVRSGIFGKFNYLK